MLGPIEMVACVAERANPLPLHCRHVQSGLQSCILQGDIASAVVLIGRSWLCCGTLRAPV